MHKCLKCHLSIPVLRNRNAEYCSKKCKKLSYQKRNPPKRRLRSATLYRNIVVDLLGGMCVDCWTTDDLEIDHVIPVVFGGKDNIENLHILCRKHHAEKSKKENRKTDYAFFGRMGGYQKAKGCYGAFSWVNIC